MWAPTIWISLVWWFRVWTVHLFCCFYRSDTIDFLSKPHPDVIDIRRRFEADQADFLFLFYVSKRDLYAKMVWVSSSCFFRWKCSMYRCWFHPLGLYCMVESVCMLHFADVSYFDDFLWNKKHSYLGQEHAKK